MTAEHKVRVRVALLLLIARGQHNGDTDAFDLAEHRRLEAGLPPFTCDEQQAATMVLAALRRKEGAGLNDVLRLYALRTVSTGSRPVSSWRNVIEADGTVLLGNVSCFEVWPWLRETGRWPLNGTA